MAAPYWDVNVKSTSDADAEKRHPRTWPLKVRKGLRPGRIKGIDVGFPSGCAGLVGVQVYLRETILAPTDSGEWVHGNGKTWHWELDWPVYGAGNYIGIKVYNEDDTYEHTVSIKIDLLPFTDIPMTDTILSQIQMTMYEIRDALLTIPHAIQSVVDAVMSLVGRR